MAVEYIFPEGSRYGQWISCDSYKSFNYTAKLTQGAFFNNTGNAIYVSSIVLPLGSGSGRWTDENGSTINVGTAKNISGVYVKINGKSSTTNTVANNVTSGCSETLFTLYKFQFTTPVKLENQSYTQIIVNVPNNVPKSSLLASRPSNNRNIRTAYGYIEYTAESPSDKFTVKFYSGYATSNIPLPGEAQSVQVPSGQSATPPTFTRNGYTFAGWLGNYKNVTKDEDVYATWEAVQAPSPSPIWIRQNGRWVKKTDIYKYSKSTKTWSKIE